MNRKLLLGCFFACALSVVATTSGCTQGGTKQAGTSPGHQEIRYRNAWAGRGQIMIPVYVGPPEQK